MKQRVWGVRSTLWSHCVSYHLCILHYSTFPQLLHPFTHVTEGGAVILRVLLSQVIKVAHRAILKDTHQPAWGQTQADPTNTDHCPDKPLFSTFSGVNRRTNIQETLIKHKEREGIRDVQLWHCLSLHHLVVFLPSDPLPPPQTRPRGQEAPCDAPMTLTQLQRSSGGGLRGHSSVHRESQQSVSVLTQVIPLQFPTIVPPEVMSLLQHGHTSNRSIKSFLLEWRLGTKATHLLTYLWGESVNFIVGPEISVLFTYLLFHDDGMSILTSVF